MSATVFLVIAIAASANFLPWANGQSGKPIPPNSCGKGAFEPRVNQRIVGGAEVVPHSLPWIVSMSRIAGIHFCGGTLIRVSPKVDESDIIITAAHCVEDTSRQVQALFGAHNSMRPEQGTVSIPVVKIVPHQNYSMKAYNDIAIMKLEKPVKFGQWIQPACLPGASDKVSDTARALLSGWGRLEEEGKGPDVLQQVVLPIISSDECVAAFKKNKYPLVIKPAIQLCAGEAGGGRDSCKGDSGGPLVIKSRDGWVLQGVVSFGKGCARPGWPGVYSRVTAYVDWINKNIKELSTVKGAQG